MPRFHRLLRYGVAAILLVYGFAKLNGSQFTILDSELDKPMGHVSGFWLTWYYFGYSKIYGDFIALGEIGGALLLLFRRTTLLGACVLLPLMINVVLVDLCFGIDAGATGVAMLVVVALLLLLAPDKDRLIALFWPPQLALGPESGAAKWAVRGFLIAFAALFTYWTANYNNRAPTPIDGAWDVVSIDTPDLTAAQPVAIFFEYNRAHLCVYRDAGGRYEWRHFEVDPSTQTIRIWRKWLAKGELLFSGRYEMGPNALVFNRQSGGSGQWREIRLRKRLT